MREIKFRVWNIDNSKIFCYESLKEGKWVVEATDDQNNNINLDGVLFAKGVRQQFTGLLDFNKKEIYEGDIVRYDARGEIEESPVYFEDGAFCVGDDLLAWTNIYSICVVGNIFENPELLK